MKKNKKILYSVVIGAIIVGISFAYAHIDKMHMLYDKNVDTSEYIATGVINNGMLEQTFVCSEDTLDGMYVKCQLFGEADRNVLKYELLEVDSDEVAAEGEIQTKDIENNQFTKLFFNEKAENCRGKNYIFRLQQPNVLEEQGVGFCYENKVEAGTKLVIDGEEKEGTMIAKTITKRFDIETFVVFLGFIVFIGAFIKILYGMFK